MSSPTAVPGSVNNPSAGENLVLKSLIAECQDVGDRIVTVAGSLDRVAAAAFVVLGIAGTVVVAANKTYFLMLLPTAVWSVALYYTFVTNDIKCMGAYKYALEEEVNRQLNFPVVIWESKVVRLGDYNFIYQVLYFIVFGLAFVLSSIIAGVQAFKTNSVWYESATIGSIALGVGAVITGAVRAQKNAKATYSTVDDAYKDAYKKASSQQTAQQIAPPQQPAASAPPQQTAPPQQPPAPAP
jgi:hypothetical protein